MVKIKVLEMLEKRGHSKYWLFKRMGLSYQNISKIWNGETTGMRYENMERLCKLLDCTPNDLFEIEFDSMNDDIIEEAERRARKKYVNEVVKKDVQTKTQNEIKKAKRGRPSKTH